MVLLILVDLSNYLLKDCLEIILKTFNYSENIKINETKLSKIRSKEKWPLNVSFDISKLNNLLGIKLTKLSEACIKMKNLHNLKIKKKYSHLNLLRIKRVKLNLFI